MLNLNEISHTLINAPLVSVPFKINNCLIE